MYKKLLRQVPELSNPFTVSKACGSDHKAMRLDSILCNIFNSKIEKCKS